MSSKPQSHSLGTSGKSEVDDLFVAERQFAKEQHADGTLKEVGVNYQVTIPDPHLPGSEERWALDALRNCKFYSYVNTDILIKHESSIMYYATI